MATSIIDNNRIQYFILLRERDITREFRNYRQYRRMRSQANRQVGLINFGIQHYQYRLIILSTRPVPPVYELNINLVKWRSRRL